MSIDGLGPRGEQSPELKKEVSEQDLVVIHVVKGSLSKTSQDYAEPKEMQSINVQARKIKEETDLFLHNAEADRARAPTKYDALKSLLDGKVAEEKFVLEGKTYSDVGIRDFAMGATPISGNLLNTQLTAPSLDQRQSIQSKNFKELNITDESFKKSNFYKFQQAIEQTGKFHDPRSATNSILALVSQAQDAIVSPMQEYYTTYGEPPIVQRTSTQIDIDEKHKTLVLTTKEILTSYIPENTHKVMESTCVITIPISEFNKRKSDYGKNSDMQFLFNQELKTGRRRDIVLQPIKTVVNAAGSTVNSALNVASSTVQSATSTLQAASSAAESIVRRIFKPPEPRPPEPPSPPAS